jgi:hypothetical protein
MKSWLFGIDVYIVKIDGVKHEIDDVLMLFAAACIILKGLSTQTLTKHGFYPPVTGKCFAL